MDSFHKKCVLSLELSVLTVCLLCIQLRLMTQCSGSLKDIKRVSLILDDDVDGDELPEELGLTVPTASEKQSGETHRMCSFMLAVMDCAHYWRSQIRFKGQKPHEPIVILVGW